MDHRRIRWILTTPVLLVAGVVALLPLVSPVRRPVSLPRLMAQALGSTLAVSGAVWRGWVILWLIAQHW